MADKKISDYTATTSVAASDVFEMENAGGNSRKITGTNMAAGLDALSPRYEVGPAATVPTVASFAWINQGTSTATDVTGGILLVPQADSNVHILKASTPGTPFDVYMRAEMLTTSTASTTAILHQTGIVLRDGTNSDFLNVNISHSRPTATAGANLYLVAIDYWTGATTFSTTPLSVALDVPPKWLRVNVTSTTVTVYVSTDGRNWMTLGTETIATRVGSITEYGISTRASVNNSGANGLVSYFSTTAPA